MKGDGMRAQRFSLHFALRYRRVGEMRWREGLTENISRSGVLFRTDGVVEVGTLLEMAFELAGTPAPPQVVCRGRIVRIAQAGDTEGSALAATISGYRFVRDAHAAA